MLLLSTFPRNREQVNIPVSSLIQSEFSMNKNSTQAYTRTQTNVSNKTFLLVDDEHVILSCISLLLEARGHQVLTAGSVTAAMQVMKQKSEAIDCLIIDYSLPTTNGLQLLNQFRSIGWTQPAIICSSFEINLEDHPNAQYWPEYVLAKPLGFDRLLKGISIALNLQTSGLSDLN